MKTSLLPSPFTLLGYIIIFQLDKYHNILCMETHSSLTVPQGEEKKCFVKCLSLLQSGARHF